MPYNQSTIPSVFFPSSVQIDQIMTNGLSLYQSPVWASTRECRAERSAAKSAGQLEAKTQLSLFKCHLCTIHMGGNYIEQSIAIFAIAAGSRIREKDHLRPTLYSRNTVVLVCGDCARRRGVPDKDVIIRESDWPSLPETSENMQAIGQILVSIERRLQQAKRQRLIDMQSAVRLVTPTRIAVATLATFGVNRKSPAQTGGETTTIAS